MKPPTTSQIKRFGLVLRLRRESAGLSRQSLAARSGLSEATIKGCENGARLPARKSLLRLMKVEELKLTAADVAVVLGAAELPPPQPMMSQRLAIQMGRAEEALRGAEAIAQEDAHPLLGVLIGLRAVLNVLLPQRDAS